MFFQMSVSGTSKEYPLLGTIGHTPLVRVDILHRISEIDVYAKLEYFNPGGSLKDRPVCQILLDALSSGALHPANHSDSSSGNAGIACAARTVLQYPVELVVPENASLERLKRIRAHGATPITTDALKGYDEALREVHRRAGSDPKRYFYADQYSISNWSALLRHCHGNFGADWRADHPFCHRHGRGHYWDWQTTERTQSCHSGDCCSRRVPWCGRPQTLGSPEAIIPAILDERVIDARVDVAVEDAYEMCWRLARAGFFVGQSSGAYMQGVHTVAKTVRTGRCHPI